MKLFSTRRLYLISSLVILCLYSTASIALELWVDRNSLGGTCSDERGRQQVSDVTPWCTLGVAGIEAIAGDTVRVREGVYDETQTCDLCLGIAVLEVLNTGSSDAWIRFLAQPGENVVLDGGNGPRDGILINGRYAPVFPEFIEINGFEIRNFRRQSSGVGNCVKVQDTSDVLLRDLDIHSCTSSAVEFHATDRVVLEDSRIHDNSLDSWTSAVDLFQCGRDNVIRRNLIWNNIDVDRRESEGHGVIMDMCRPSASALIENNVIWNNEGWCIVVLEADNATVRHNTCWHNGLGRPDTGEIIFLGNNLRIFNNVLEPQSGRLAMYIRDRTRYPVDLGSIRADGNLIWAPGNDIVVGWGQGLFGTVADYQSFNAYGWGANVIEADPRLTNPGNSDFRPLSGSAAVDTAVDSSPATDVESNSRPVDGDGNGSAVADRGAYEVASGGGGGDQPIAALNVDPAVGAQPLTVTFDGRASSDDNGIAIYRFDFGDFTGTYDDRAVVEHTYTRSGEYHVSLEVIDGQGNSDHTQAVITVGVSRGTGPVAEFTADPLSGAAPLTVRFDGRASTDDQDIAIYRFDFGDYQGTYGEQAVVEHTYPAPGRYKVALEVFDNQGNSFFPVVEIRVGAP